MTKLLDSMRMVVPERWSRGGQSWHRVPGLRGRHLLRCGTCWPPPRASGVGLVIAAGRSTFCRV